MLKLDDFGFSKKWENLYKSTYNGDTEYMSAEYLAGKEINESVDLWSQGILLYEMLQGEVPFKSVNLTTQINKMKSAYSELFNKIKYSMSDEVKNLLRKLLTYNPADRISIKAIKKHQWIILNREIIDENFKFIEKILFEKFKETMEPITGYDSPKAGYNKGQNNDKNSDENAILDMLIDAYVEVGQQFEIQTVFTKKDEFNTGEKKLSKVLLENRLDFEPPIEDMTNFGISVESQQELKYQLIKLLDAPKQVPKVKKMDESYEIYSKESNTKIIKRRSRSLSIDSIKINNRRSIRQSLFKNLESKVNDIEISETNMVENKEDYIKASERNVVVDEIETESPMVRKKGSTIKLSFNQDQESQHFTPSFSPSPYIKSSGLVSGRQSPHSQVKKKQNLSKFQKSSGFAQVVDDKIPVDKLENQLATESENTEKEECSKSIITRLSIQNNRDVYQNSENKEEKGFITKILKYFGCT